MSEKRMTLKQERFIIAYLGEAKGNGSKAARIAGYAQPDEEAYRLLRNVEIRARIDEQLRAEALTAAEVLHELTTVARADWEKFVEFRSDGDGGLRAKIVLADKVKALELLGKYHKLFTDKTELTGPGGGAVQVMDISRLTDEELLTLEQVTEKLALPAGNPSGTGEA